MFFLPVGDPSSRRCHLDPGSVAAVDSLAVSLVFAFSEKAVCPVWTDALSRLDTFFMPLIWRRRTPLAKFKPLEAVSNSAIEGDCGLTKCIAKLVA